MFELSAPLPQHVAAYFFFCDSIRARVREANKDKKMTELSGIMATEWKELGDEEKQVRRLTCITRVHETTLPHTTFF